MHAALRMHAAGQFSACMQEGKAPKLDKLLNESDSEEEVADVEFQARRTQHARFPALSLMTTSSSVPYLPIVDPDYDVNTSYPGCSPRLNFIRPGVRGCCLLGY